MRSREPGDPLGPRRNWLIEFLLDCLRFGAVYLAALIVGGLLLIVLVFVIGWIRSMLGW